MTPVTEIILASIVGIVLYMTFFYLISVFTKRISIVDTAWGLGFVLIAVIAITLSSTFTWVQILLTALVTIWGVRLSVYISLRNKGKKEDFRYKMMKRAWGTRFLVRSFFKVFILKGFLLLVIAYPIFHVNFVSKVRFAFLALLGVVVWLAGFLIETIADYQNYKFKKEPNNRERIMTKGLWKYSRHPNYFGEILIWWSFFLIAASVDYGWTAIISPLFLTFLIIKVSGIPLLEKRYEGNKKYDAYKKKTHALILWFPKRVK